MKKSKGSNSHHNLRNIVLLGAVLCTAVFGLVSFRARAQQRETAREVSAEKAPARQTATDYPYQVFLYNGLPYNDPSPPVTEQARAVEVSEVTTDTVFAGGSKSDKTLFSSLLLGVVNPQPAILGATDASSRAVVFPDPGSAPATQSLVPLPAGARPHGVAYYGSDSALISDFLNSRVHVVQISTASLVSTIDTSAAGYNGTGTIAVAPNLTAALAVGSDNSLKVIHGPFGPASAITTLALPGVIAGYQTEAIVFNNAGRAFVYNTAGISVLDAPYTSIAFTIPVSNGTSGSIGISPDGNTILTTNLSDNQVRIFQAPFSAASTATLLTIPGGSGLDGIMVAPDGAHAIVVSGFAHHAASIAAPFSSSSTVETLPLPSGSVGFEDVGISADSQLAFLTGNSTSESAILVKAPFTAAGATSANVPIVGVGNPARGNGAVRFLPPGLAPGLTISKSAPATVGSGANLTYTINYGNTGSVGATNVVISDPLPAGTSFVSATNGGSLVAGNVVFNIGTINAGGSGNVAFTVTVNLPLGGTVSNNNYTISADGVSPIAGPPVTTSVTNSQPTIMAIPVTRQQGTSSNSPIATVNDAEDAENNLVVSVVGPSTVNGVTVSGISVNAAGSVTATVAAGCGASNASFTLQVMDTGALTATATLNVTVTPETTPPVINPITNVVATLPPNSMSTSMPVSFPLPTATDNCSVPTVTTSPVSGSIFNVGTTTVTVTAMDALGNTSTATFTVTVQYAFIGFGGRVSNPPVVNYVVAGNQIPVSFSLSGYKGLNIFAAGSPSSRQVNCMDGTPIGASSPANLPLGLFYFGDQYTFYWQTAAAWHGTCRRLSVALNDGTTKAAEFHFFD